MTITEILRLRGLNTTKRIKLVRHQDKRYDVHELARRGRLEIYQAYQSQPRFDCDYIISFLGDEGTRALFWGVYRVAGREPASQHPPPPDLAEFEVSDGFFYDFVEEPGYDDLRRRLVINWGAGLLAWHQWLSPKEVIELLPA